MSDYQIAKQVLCDKIMKSTIEALRMGVPINTVTAALKQASDELTMMAPFVMASVDAVKHGKS